jgi:hypothetical protein
LLPIACQVAARAFAVFGPTQQSATGVVQVTDLLDRGIGNSGGEVNFAPTDIYYTFGKQVGNHRLKRTRLSGCPVWFFG